MILQEGALFLGINQYNNMSKIITNKEFIEKSNKIYNNKYDYSKTQYKDHKKKIIITCYTHGDFEQKAENHLNGAGCPECLKDKKRINFIEKSNIIHHNKYDYSKTKYVLSNTKVIITCLEHGDFNQTPGKHMVNYIKKH